MPFWVASSSRVMTPPVIGGARCSENFLGLATSVVISSNALGEVKRHTLFEVRLKSR